MGVKTRYALVKERLAKRSRQENSDDDYCPTQSEEEEEEDDGPNYSPESDDDSEDDDINSSDDEEPTPQPPKKRKIAMECVLPSEEIYLQEPINPVPLPTTPPQTITDTTHSQQTPISICSDDDDEEIDTNGPLFTPKSTNLIRICSTIVLSDDSPTFEDRDCIIILSPPVFPPPFNPLRQSSDDQYHSDMEFSTPTPSPPELTNEIVECLILDDDNTSLNFDDIPDICPPIEQPMVRSRVSLAINEVQQVLGTDPDSFSMSECTILSQMKCIFPHVEDQDLTFFQSYLKLFEWEKDIFRNSLSNK